MKKYHCRLSWYVLLFPALMISVALGQETGPASDQPEKAAQGSHQSPSANPDGMSKMFEGTVVEVIDAGRHIYIRVNTGETLVWIAVTAFDGKPGDKVLVPPGVPVANLHSKKLNRVFKMIYFVGGVRLMEKNASK